MNLPALSRRSGSPQHLNRLARALAGRDRRSLVDLTASNPTRVGLGGDPSPLARALEAGSAGVYAPHPFGLPAARAAIARFMTRQGAAVAPERLVLTASTSEAYGFLFKLLCDPGDEVLVPRPSYPLFEHLTRLEGVEAAPYPLRYDGRWHLPVGELRAARSQRTRAVLLVHPNNPTGSLLEAETLEAVAGLGLPIVSDEVFAAYRHGPSAAPRSALHAAGAELVFTLHGLSKQAALPQLKLGWLAAGGEPRRLDAALARLELIADSYLSVATPVQLAAGDLLQGSIATSARIQERLTDNLARLDARLGACPAVDRLHLEAGWYATVRLPATFSDEAWALRLLERDAVLTQPGYFYDFEGGPFLVLSLLTPPAAFDAGVERLLARVDASL